MSRPEPMAQTPPGSSKKPTDSQIVQKLAKPGTAMRALIDEATRARRKRRRIQITIGFIILLILLYLGVTSFIFNPIEPAAGEFQNAVPANVHVFLRKRGLADDLPLPATAVTPLGDGAIWKAFEQGRLGVPQSTVREWMNDYDEFIKSTSSAPIDIMRDLLGREICIGARFVDKGGLEATRYCLYLRAGWRIRAGMGLARYEYFRNKIFAGFRTDVIRPGVYKLSGQGMKDIFVTIHSDMLMVASDDEWLREVDNLLQDRQGSFGLTSQFAEDIRGKLQQRIEALNGLTPSNIQFYFDIAAFHKAAGGATKWPDPNGPTIDERFVASLYHRDLLLDAAGVIRFEGSPRKRIAIDATFRTDTSKLGPFGERIYKDKWNQQLAPADIRLIQEMVPQSSFAGGAFAVSGGDIARQFEALLSAEDRRVADDAPRATGKYSSLKALMDDVAIALGDRAIFALRENNYLREDKDPEVTSVDPAVALVFQQRSPEKIRQLMEYFKNNKSTFGITATYTWPIDNIYELLEFYNNFVPGNGEIAVLPVGADERSNVMISNQAKLIRSIQRAWLHPEHRDDRPYGEDPWFKDLTSEFKNRKVNAYAFVNGPKLSKALKKYTDVWSRGETQLSPEAMRDERPKIFKKILGEKYPSIEAKNITEEIRKEIDALVDSEFETREAQASANVPVAIREKYENLLKCVGAVSGVFATVELEVRRVHINGNVFVE